MAARKPPFPRKGDAIAVSGRAANGYPVKGGGIREADDGGLHFGEAKICEANTVLQILVYFVCFAARNAILSQPSADSPFQKGLFGAL